MFCEGDDDGIHDLNGSVLVVVVVFSGMGGDRFCNAHG